MTTVAVVAHAGKTLGGGLGELIFTGIDLMEPSMLLAGAIPTAVLAILVDYLVGQCQYWLIPRGVNPLR